MDWVESQWIRWNPTALGGISRHWVETHRIGYTATFSTQNYSQMAFQLQPLTTDIPQQHLI